MDQMHHCYSPLSRLPHLGTQLVGADCRSFHLRYLYHQENTLVILEKSKNPTVRNVMSWVDAIVFALVAVYFVNIYIFQNYQIPSSSLEKSLLVGDFLYVSKMSYGPRVPNTPLSMPLAQHTLPILNTKSYIEWPQWKYKECPGSEK